MPNPPNVKVGILMVALACTLVGGWRLLIIARQPPHILDIATEIGSIADSKEEQFNREIIPNHSGTALLFFQETETGIGTYFCSISDDKPKLLFEQSEKGYNQEYALLDWSPDDKAFAYFTQPSLDPDRPQRKITIYNGMTGEIIMQMSGENFLPYSRFVMLSSRAFVYSTYYQTLILMSENLDGTWSEQPGRVGQNFPKPVPDGEMNNFTAVSDHSLAWQQQGEIWTYDFKSGSCVKIWESKTNQLEYFSYDMNTEYYQLICRNQTGEVSVQFRPPMKGFPDSTELKLLPYQRPNFADLTESRSGYSFVIKTDSQSTSTSFIWPGMIEYYALSGDRLFFTGNLPDGPPGIWVYDTKSRVTSCLDSGLKHNFTYAKLVTPAANMATNDAGKTFNYHVWSPTRIVTGKKYPLIIGQTHYMWFSYPQIAANAGYYYVAADRLSWWDGINDWDLDVKRLYEILSKTPYIDTNRVYLLGTSVESSYLANLIDKYPLLWKGTIMFSPTILPDLSKESMPRMLIVGGKDDGDSAMDLMKYQEASAKTGVPIRLLLQDGVQHITRSVGTERERARQFALFLLNAQ